MQPELQNQQSYQQVPQTNAALPNVPQQPSGAIGSGPNPNTPSPDKTPDDKKQKGPISTQNTLLFSEMRENMIIMSDGSFRAVVECESINFDLMSSREREGIEFSYQNFINSLYFPIQVLIRSRRVDIGPYLDRLAEIRRNQDNMLLNVLMDDYMDFIDIHETSASQMLMNIRLFESDNFAKSQLNRTACLGKIDLDKLNHLGGSIAFGNPRAVTSLRTVIQSLFALKRKGGGTSLVASSGWGGLGAAMVLETE